MAVGRMYIPVSRFIPKVVIMSKIICAVDKPNIKTAESCNRRFRAFPAVQKM